MVGSPGCGRIALTHRARTLPGVSFPSSVVRSIIEIARSSAHIFDAFLIERLLSESTRSSTPTWSTAVTRPSRLPSGPGRPSQARISSWARSRAGIRGAAWRSWDGEDTPRQRRVARSGRSRGRSVPPLAQSNACQLTSAVPTDAIREASSVAPIGGMKRTARWRIDQMTTLAADAGNLTAERAAARPIPAQTSRSLRRWNRGLTFAHGIQFLAMIAISATAVVFAPWCRPFGRSSRTANSPESTTRA